MDFVVSKVAMAICALMVVAVLAGVFSGGALVGRAHGFEHILTEFCELTERAGTTGPKSSIVWIAPYLPDGDGVTISIHRGIVLIESNDGSAADRPSRGIHVWHPDGRELNRSTVEALDRSAGTLSFESGQSVEIVAKSVTYENEQRLFVFAYLVG